MPAEQAIVDAAVTASGRGDPIGACRLWRHALALIPDSGTIALSLGIACVSRGDLRGAATGFAAAVAMLDLDDRAAALNGLAAVERGRGRFTHAQRWLERAILLLPGDAVLWSNRAELARIRAMGEIAYRSILRALALAPGQPDIEYNYLLLLDGLPAEGKRQGALQLSGSKDSRIRRAIPALLALAGDYEAALAASHEVEALFPEDGLLVRATGCMHFALGDTAAAARSFRRAAALTPAVRKSPGDIREIVLVPEDELPARAESSLSDGAYAQHLMHADDAVVLKESWATVLPDGGCYLRRFIPSSQGAVEYLDYSICLHDERMLITMPSNPPSGPSGAVLVGGCPNFSHWLNDWSSKLRLILTREDLQRRPLVVYDRLPGYAQDLMRILGIDTTRLHRQRSIACRYRDLWLPSMSHRYKELPPAHATWLRERLSVPSTPRGRPRRLFMSRRHARYRRIANLDELAPVIRRFGLEEVYPEAIPLAAQLELFADAELWLGVLGGGSASILLCPTTCKVIELTHRRILLDQYERMARTIGQDYRRVVGEVTQLGDRPPEYDFDWDLVVPTAELERSLAQALR
jgi:capsular polysaccharide biosynthesis protein/tetratricopeptide (TPR) repeat protein